MTNATGDVAYVTGRRVRLPVHLLTSVHHSVLAVLVWALLDLLGSRDRQGVAGVDVTFGCRWLADRLGASKDGIAKALGKLTRPHVGEGAVPDSPVYVTSTVRGRQRTAARRAVHGIPYVEVPEASLGDDVAGLLVSPAAWRLYALYLHKRHPRYFTVKFGAAELGRMLHVRPATISALRAELVAAGLVVVAERDGHAPVVCPLAQITAAGREWAVATLSAACGQTVDEAVDNPLWTLITAGGTCALPGTSPPAPAGTSGSAPAGTSIEDPPYRDPNYENPAPVRAFAPSAHARAERQARPPSPPAAAGRRLQATPLGADLQWCGRCSDSQRRLTWDDTTGRVLDEPCPTCAPGPRVWLGNAIGYATTIRRAS